MNVIRYAHYRKFTKDGKIDSRGGMTVAYVVTPDNKVVKSATAYCSERDNYSRPRGRALAAGRLNFPHLSERMVMDRDGFLEVRDTEAAGMGLLRRQRKVG